jgi:lipoyl(octanoyl) transferase
MNKIQFHDLQGLSDFESTWRLQETFQNEIIQARHSSTQKLAGHLIFCEHTHTYTLGRFGNQENLLIDRLRLQDSGVLFHHIDRGGDITYHGPGQLVGYPIFHLDVFQMGVKSYVYTMEQAVIDMLAQFGIVSSRLEKATGVWIQPDSPVKARKICAIGIKVNRGVTMHGFALNINTDLSFFNAINPCGFTDKTVTSMEKELSARQDMHKVKKALLDHLFKCFHAENLA